MHGGTSLTEEQLKSLTVGSPNQLKEALVAYGIPAGLIFEYDGQEGNFALFNNVGQALARRAGEGEWAFTQFPQGYLDKIRGQVAQAEVTGGVDKYVRIVIGRYRQLINDAHGTSANIDTSSDKTMEYPLILTDRLDITGELDIIPNSRHEGGIERAFSDVTTTGGGLIGIIGGFDFIASIAANGRFSHVVGFDINPAQLLVGAIRASLCKVSPTPYHYLSNLLSLDFDDAELRAYENLHDFFLDSEGEMPDSNKNAETWHKLERILRCEQATDIFKFRKVWNEMSGLYARPNAVKRSIVSGASIRIYLRELEEVNLRNSEGHVSWLANQANYNKVRRLVSGGKFVLMLGDLFEQAVQEAQKHLQMQGVAVGAVYVSNVPTYSHPSPAQLENLDKLTSELRGKGIYVTDGSYGRGMSFQQYSLRANQ